VCAKPSSARAGDPAAPFCSERCRLVDLGRWLGEDYRIPAEPAGDGAGTLQGDSPNDD
jgi:endogenous inhibitor of DNA gyrase (YacG/DUF329 family)